MLEQSGLRESRKEIQGTYEQVVHPGADEEQVGFVEEEIYPVEDSQRESCWVREESSDWVYHSR